MRVCSFSGTPSRLLHAAVLCSALACSAALLLAQESAEPKEVPVGEATQRQFKHAAIIRLEGEINPWLQSYLERKLAAAKAAGAELIILEVHSGGGHLHESSAMAQLMNKLADVHTVAYIPDFAFSGAAMISLGCDEIVMHPGARIGDVGVIVLKEFMFQHAEEKIRSPVVTEMRALAADHRRPPALAESMVDLHVEVFRYVNRRTNAEDFFTESDIASKADAADWEKRELVLESKKGSFLTVTGSRAVELRLAEATVANLDELKSRYEVAGKWKHYRVDAVDQTVYILTLWWVTGLLFVVGLSGILYEFSAPGTCLGGLVGLTCFSLFYWSRFLGGTSGWLEVVLFLLGVVFLGIELFVLPGFGVAGFAGLALMGVSIILACQNFVLPETARDLNITFGAVVTLLTSGLVFFAIAYAMTSYIGRIPVLSQLVLAPTPSTDNADETVENDALGIPAAKKIPVGAIGQTTTILRPSGRAVIDGQPVDVVSTGDVIGAGVKIRVVETGYLRIVVEEAEPS